MSKKVVQIVLALFLVFTLTAASAQSHNHDSNIIDEGSRTYCEAYAGNPYKSGSNVYGLGYVACTTSVSRITVVV
jgi:hypothetical protein